MSERKWVCFSCLRQAFQTDEKAPSACADVDSCGGPRSVGDVIGAPDEWQRMRAIVRCEVQRESSRIFRIQYESMGQRFEDLTDALLVELRKHETVEGVPTAEVVDDASGVLNVFAKAAEKSPDQCQSLKHLCKTLGLPSSRVVLVLDALERAGKIYSRPYFRSKLWYLTGFGPGPVKPR